MWTIRYLAKLLLCTFREDTKRKLFVDELSGKGCYGPMDPMSLWSAGKWKKKANSFSKFRSRKLQHQHSENALKPKLYSSVGTRSYGLTRATHYLMTRCRTSHVKNNPNIFRLWHCRPGITISPQPVTQPWLHMRDVSTPDHILQLYSLYQESKPTWSQGTTLEDNI